MLFDALRFIVPLGLVAVALVMIISPVKFAGLCALVGRRGLISREDRWSNPTEVQRSSIMRIEYRIAGLVILMIGLMIAWDELSGGN
jgi:hypothetical protein